MDLHVLWFVLLGLLLIGYAFLDGFDLGVGMLHLFVKDDRDRQLLLKSIGPLWDGNEVWLVVFAGALFAAFPEAYATSLSSFYLLFMLLLGALVSRAVSIELRNQSDSVHWRTFFDVTFSLASYLATFLYGVFVANCLLGLPIDAHHEFAGGLRDIVWSYALVGGLFTVATFTLHGAIYLYLKTEGELQDRMRRWVWRAYLAFLAMYLVFAVVTYLGVRDVTRTFRDHPHLWGVVALNVLAIASIPVAMRLGRPMHAFLASGFKMAMLVCVFGVVLFPNLIVSTLGPEYNLTIYNAASSQKTLTIIAVVAAIGVPFVLTYTVAIYWVFRAKVRLGDITHPDPYPERETAAVPDVIVVPAARTVHHRSHQFAAWGIFASLLALVVLGVVLLDLFTKHVIDTPGAGANDLAGIAPKPGAEARKAGAVLPPARVELAARVVPPPRAPQPAVKTEKPTAAQAAFNAGAEAHAKGDHPKAIEQYSQAVKADPKDTKALYNRGLAHLALGDPASAVKDFTEVIRLDPKNGTAYFDRGLAHARLNDHDTAIADFDKAIELKPDPQQYLHRGLSRFAKKQHAEAVQDLSKVIDADGKNTVALFTRGLANLHLKANDAAIADFTRTIDLDPKDADARYNRGLAHMHKTEYPPAAADFTEAIRLLPGKPAYLERGLALYFQKQYAEAAADFTRVIEADANDPNGYFNRGLARYGLRDYAGAVADFTKCLELEPKPDAVTLLCRSRAYRAQGNFQSADADRAKALQLDPDVEKK